MFKRLIAIAFQIVLGEDTFVSSFLHLLSIPLACPLAPVFLVESFHQFLRAQDLSCELPWPHQLQH